MQIISVLICKIFRTFAVAMRKKVIFIRIICAIFAAQLR